MRGSDWKLMVRGVTLPALAAPGMPGSIRDGAARAGAPSPSKPNNTNRGTWFRLIVDLRPLKLGFATMQIAWLAAPTAFRARPEGPRFYRTARIRSTPGAGPAPFRLTTI